MAWIDSIDDGLDGYQLQVWAVPSACGQGYAARLAVRRMPTLSVVFEDDVLRGDSAWALPQQALAAALERGRRFMRTDPLVRATQVLEGRGVRADR